MREKNANYYKEIKQAVENMQRLEVAMNKEEQEVEGKEKRLADKRKELEKATEEARELKDKIKAELEKSDKVDITKENVLVYVKPMNQVHDCWLKAESKRKSIEACMLLLKKLYEDKTIKLEVFLESVRKFSVKEFVNIYKKSKFEGMARHQARVKK